MDVLWTAQTVLIFSYFTDYGGGGVENLIDTISAVSSTTAPWPGSTSMSSKIV